MGCDIHAMIEAKYRYRRLADCWSWQGCGEIHISRNYRLFAKIAGVRNYDNIAPIAEPRFSDITSETCDETCSETFKRWSLDYGADGHSHSWVSLDELQVADVDLAARCRLIVMAHGLDASDARLTFFFDN
jgi:hypothetical protein